MLIQQLTILFSILMFTLAASMFFHTYQSRRKILKNLNRISGEVEGKASQKNILSYPSFEGRAGGRKVTAFFHTAEGKQTSIIYFTSTIEARAPFNLFLKKEDFFRPVQNGRMEKNAGFIIPGLDAKFEARGNDETRSRKFFQNEKMIAARSRLENYAAIVCGPDAVIISKPYDGVKDTDPAAIRQGFNLLREMAEAMETVA